MVTEEKASRLPRPGARRAALTTLRWVRAAVQTGSFWLLGEWLYKGTVRCPFVVPFIACDHCPVQSCPGSYLRPWTGRLLLLSMALFGRGWCGWACPLGFLQDALAKLRRPQVPVRGVFPAMDALLKMGKYVFLLFVLFLIYGPLAEQVGNELLRQPPPHPTAFLRIVLAVGTLAAAPFLSRAWCRYLCPLGGLLAIGNRFSLFAFRRNERKCADCGLYPRACPTYTTAGTADCIACGDCVYGCPKGALSFGLRGKAEGMEEER
jgi:polyferredoxin